MSKKDLEKSIEQIDSFEESCKQLTLDRLNATPKKEVEPQTKLSSREIEKSQEIYLKPEKTVGARDKFNEKFREDYNHAKEYVRFIAENREIGGEVIELWTRPFGGMPAEFWKVPPNKPVWGPRYLAERIKKCFYHRLIMQDNVMTSQNGVGTLYGQIVADSTIQRLDALPVSARKSIFMGEATGF